MKNIIDSGLSKEDFLSQVVDRRMYIKRWAVSPSLIQWEHLNVALSYIDPMPPHVRIHHHGLVPEANYVEDHVVAGVAGKRLKTAAVQRMLEQGATIVLNRLEGRFALMGRLCAEVSQFADAATLANGYLAFSGKGSFGRHWDTHDVMALQLIGRKHRPETIAMAERVVELSALGLSAPRVHATVPAVGMAA
jgi:ribosomal protein L16 Arg81 hydroxylase